MPRPRAFDDDAVRERVADLFTAHGYQGTSIAMLTEASGLGKQSLYNAFGDKRALYLQSLDLTAQRMAGAREEMAAAATGLASIHVLFEGLLVVCHDPDPARHTCIVSAGLLEGIDEPEVNDRLRKTWQSTDALLRKAIQRGQKDGSIRTDAKVAELSALLMTMISGLRVTARVLGNAGQLHAITERGLKCLEPTD
jgi:TetR/AcrR family transcriptional regulator, transcriptional repressor for nem operon